MYNEKELIWISALGAISVFGPCIDLAQFDVIHSVLNNKTAFSEPMLKQCTNNKDIIQKRINVILEFYHIDYNALDYKKTSFLNHVYYLLDRNNKQLLSFNSNLYILLKQSESELKVMIKSKGLSNKSYLESIKNYSMVLGRNSYYAYNISNAISLLRIAWYLNVIDNKTYIDNILDISRVVKRNFVSYYDFGAQVVAVQDIMSKHPENKQKSFYRLINENQLPHVMYRLWEYIPWMGRTDL